MEVLFKRGYFSGSLNKNAMKLKDTFAITEEMIGIIQIIAFIGYAKNVEAAEAARIHPQQ